MFRRTRSAATAPPPDPALMTLVETTGAAARAAGSFREAVERVLRDVAGTTGWAAGHAWVPADDGWASMGVWYPEDGIALGALRRACVEAPAGPVRGHLALALHMETTQWVADLGGLSGTPTHDAAVAAGVVSALACPVYSHGVPIALLEWYVADDRRPSPDVAHVLGHLSTILTDVAERPVRAIPEQGRMRDVRETLRWVTEDGVMARLLTC
jgi:hypothetical protein